MVHRTTICHKLINYILISIINTKMFIKYFIFKYKFPVLLVSLYTHFIIRTVPIHRVPKCVTINHVIASSVYNMSELHPIYIPNV